MSLADKGHRTVLHALDYLSQHDPTRVYASVPLSSKDVERGFRDVTVREICHGVDSLAHWIAQTLGPSTTFETISYIGLNDLRYPLIVMAAIKCGYKILLLSPQNPKEQNMRLLRKTHCLKVFSSPEMSHITQDLLSMEIIPLAPFEKWIATYAGPYPFTKTFEECKNDPIVVLHSSGSTGDPKPIMLTHAYYAADDMPLPNVPGREYGPTGQAYQGDCGPIMAIWPFFHQAGTLSTTIFPLFTKRSSCILYPSEQPVTTHVLKYMLRQKQVSVLALAPVFVEELVRDPDALPLLRNVDCVSFGGGPLNPTVGDFLVANDISAANVYGQSEMNMPCLLKPKDPHNWAWLEWHPALKLAFEPAGQGTYEMVMNPDPEAEMYRAAYALVSDKMQQLRSKDLFIPHPTEVNLWKFYARADDVLVFRTGKKWFPLQSEQRIMAHPKVRGVVIVGNGRPYPVALVEAEGDNADVLMTVDELWPTIEEANLHTQEQGRLLKGHIAILPSGSLARAPKGSIVRKATVTKNADVIEELYSMSRL